MEDKLLVFECPAGSAETVMRFTREVARLYLVGISLAALAGGCEGAGLRQGAHPMDSAVVQAQGGEGRRERGLVFEGNKNAACDSSVVPSVPGSCTRCVCSSRQR